MRDLPRMKTVLLIRETLQELRAVSRVLLHHGQITRYSHLQEQQPQQHPQGWCQSMGHNFMSTHERLKLVKYAFGAPKKMCRANTQKHVPHLGCHKSQITNL